MADLTALALNAAHQIPVAELHGVVCGLAACHGDELPLQDLVELVGVEALTDEASVSAFVAGALDELKAPDMRFTPLLPEDDAGLPDRLEALGQWCGSFLAGLAAGMARQGIASLKDAPEEVREIVRDFAAIAELDADASAAASDSEESAEADLFELQEFVKVGVLLVMSAFGHETDDSTE